MVEIVEPATKPFTPPDLMKKTVPIAAGLAVPLTFRDALLAKLPSGAVETLGKFGVSAADAALASATAIGTNLVVPEKYKNMGYMAAAAAGGLAIYDFVDTLTGSPESPAVEEAEKKEAEVKKRRPRRRSQSL